MRSVKRHILICLLFFLMGSVLAKPTFSLSPKSSLKPWIVALFDGDDLSLTPSQYHAGAKNPLQDPRSEGEARRMALIKELKSGYGVTDQQLAEVPLFQFSESPHPEAWVKVSQFVRKEDLPFIIENGLIGRNQSAHDAWLDEQYKERFRPDDSFRRLGSLFAFTADPFLMSRKWLEDLEAGNETNALIRIAKITRKLDIQFWVDPKSVYVADVYLLEQEPEAHYQHAITLDHWLRYKAFVNQNRHHPDVTSILPDEFVTVHEHFDDPNNKFELEIIIPNAIPADQLRLAAVSGYLARYGSDPVRNPALQSA